MSTISWKDNDNNSDDDGDDDNGENEEEVTFPNIRDWDEQRQEWMSQFGHIVSSSSHTNILLVTSSPSSPCESPLGDHYLLKSIKNKMDYAHTHHMHIFYNIAKLYPGMSSSGLGSSSWSKLPLLRNLMLTHPEIEWLWWMDDNAMFTDMSFEVPLDKYKDHNLVLHGREDEVYVKKEWVGLNTGSFLIRNCQWALDLLDVWAPMGLKGGQEMGKVLSETLVGRPPFEADDQSALVYLLITQKDLWANKVFLENSYYLDGYWVNLVDLFVDDVDVPKVSHSDNSHNRWPFVTHFMGCQTCSSYGEYSVERCLKHMERSFNFADNQILDQYGYTHKNLESFELKRTRSDTIYFLGLET